MAAAAQYFDFDATFVLGHPPVRPPARREFLRIRLLSLFLNKMSFKAFEISLLLVLLFVFHALLNHLEEVD